MVEKSDDKLRFDRPVVIVGASPAVTPERLATIDPQWPVIAVDGGLHTALAAGITPQLVIGDMDSVGQIPDGLTAIRLEGQNDTDLEKALTAIDAPMIIGFGFMDGRFDHALAAIHALTRLQREIPVLLVGSTDILVCPAMDNAAGKAGDMAISLPVGTRFSVWPFGEQHFRHSTGLLWPLDDLQMAPGRLVGTSNRVSAPDITIEAGAGDGYAVIMPAACYALVLPTFVSAITPSNLA